MAALALGSLVVRTSIASAQTTNGSIQTTNPPTRGQQRNSVEQRVRRMNEELNLTPDQKTKITALLHDEAKKRQELRADTTTPREEKLEKGQALMAEQEKKLKAILTPEQFEKWQKMRQQFRPHRPEGSTAQ